MSREQKTRLFNGIKETVMGLLMAGNIFWLTEAYNNNKQLQEDVQLLKQEIASIRTAIDFLRISK